MKRMAEHSKKFLTEELDKNIEDLKIVEFEEEDLELEEEYEEEDLELEEEDTPLQQTIDRTLRKKRKIAENVGLTVSNDTKRELDEQLEEFLSTKVKTFSTVGNRGSSYISIVKADTGTSLRLTKDVTEKLSNPTQLSVSFIGTYLVLCNADELNVLSYKGNFKNGRTTVYNTGLVDAIIKQFNLDFSNKTSISFSEGYYKQQGRTILYVKLG